MPRLLSPENYKYYPLDSVRTDALGKSVAVQRDAERFVTGGCVCVCVCVCACE